MEIGIRATSRDWPARLAGALMLAAALMLTACSRVPSPASIEGPPVRAATAGGDRVFLMSSQFKTYRQRYTRGNSYVTYTDLLIDVWGFDAANGQPVWRQRITEDRKGVNMGRAILGVQDSVLWVLQPSGLLGLSTTDGGIVADTARIEAANPALKGLLPTEVRYYAFDAGGLRFTAADGGKWRMGPGLKAVADSPPPARTAPGVALPAREAGGNSTWAFMARSGLKTQTQWLGLLASGQAAALAEGRSPDVDMEKYPRTRLYHAKKAEARKSWVEAMKSYFDNRYGFLDYHDYQPYPESPEFIQAGLLTANDIDNTPITLSAPDSLLVLHRDRLGDKGRWRISRISGPRGAVLWTADLPMQAIEAVMPGKTSLVVVGRQDDERAKTGPDDYGNISVDQLVAIDYATGRTGGYGFLIDATGPQDIPKSGAAPQGTGD
ncbi:MAG: hypothetical protein LBV50_12040 [Novosphingobium sp.]|jgi:hypothetical protein|nr:hypothetical protein [Novosphingobium sp.]